MALRRVAALAALLLLALLACTPAGPPPSGAAPPAPTAAATPQAEAAPAPEATAARPALPTTPTSLPVGTLALDSWAGVFIADARGYFRELGLAVELVPFANGTDMRPALLNGDLAVGGAGLNAGTINLIGRNTDVKIVADLESYRAGHQAADALVVRKDLWDSGAIRTAKDLEGRDVYGPGGPGGGLFLQLMRWADREGLDKSKLAMTNMGTSEIRAALAGGAIDVGFVSEPNLTAGLDAGEFVILADGQDMYPGQQILVLQYNVRAMDAAGPRAGERFMLAYLRGVRDYVNAMVYHQDQESVIDVLVQYTAVKDHEVYRHSRPSWIDPNGRVNVANLPADAAVYVQAGIIPAVPNLDHAYASEYADYAVGYLGEYRPPS